MSLETEGHIIAFVASLSRVLYQLLMTKNRMDRTGKYRWSTYMRKSWDDLVAILLFPQFLSFGYEAAFGIYAHYKGEESWGFFYDTFEGVNLIFGIFGVLIYTKLLKKGRAKIDKL